MWQQQQQGQPQGIPLQQGQYPNYAYNTNVNNNFTQPINSPILTSEKAPEVTIESCFKRQLDGPILWFAGPPLNVKSETGPVHSLAYLDWKAKQQKQ